MPEFVQPSESTGFFCRTNAGGKAGIPSIGIGFFISFFFFAEEGKEKRAGAVRPVEHVFPPSTCWWMKTPLTRAGSPRLTADAVTFGGMPGQGGQRR